MIPFIDLKSQQERIADKIQNRINDVLTHGRYIMGPEVNEMEEALVNYVGAKFCVGVSSGTDALVLALMALGVGPGDEVVVPDFSFFGTAEVVAILGAKPIFVDVDPETCNLDPKEIKGVISSKTKAIMPVSLYGQSANMATINLIAKESEIPVVEDAAQSFGAEHFGKKSCNTSLIGCTSFFPSKPLGCYGDGGAVFTSDEGLYEKIKELRVHGQSKRYFHTSIGLNARIDTIQAAIICEKLKIFDDECSKRQEVAAKYSDLLKGIVETPKVEEGNLSVYAQYTIKVENREGIQEKLKESGIPTAVHYPIPLSKQPALESYGSKENPVTDKLSKVVMSLPFSPYLTDKDQEYICETLKKAII